MPKRSPAGDEVRQDSLVPFNFLARLIEEFGKVKPDKAGRRSTSCSSDGSPRRHIDILRSWVDRLERPLTSGTGAALFRFLFPEEDKDRKFNMQETKLCRLLADVLGVDVSVGKRGHRLATWKDSDEGCLGLEVLSVAEETYSGSAHPTNPSFQDVDRLLDELALTSQWSTIRPEQRQSPKRPVKHILIDLYRDLTPFGAAVMTQIILKDLRPLVYSQPASSTSVSLLSFNSNAYEEITPHMAMLVWHPEMCKLYRTNSKLDAAAHAVEQLEASYSLSAISSSTGPFQPTLGVPVEIPKCVKGHSCMYAIRRLSGSDRLYAETKYDGERMQIHLDFSRPESSQIQIFSKSKRDSTQDRIATHSIIRAALGMPPGLDAHEQLMERIACLKSRECITQSAILEAEMVAYSELKGDIEKFWRIRGIIGATANGARRRVVRRRNVYSDATDSEDETKVDLTETQDSVRSDGTASDTRHFMLVFFDVVQLNGESLLERPYEYRRLVLKELVIPIPGFSRVARSVTIANNGSEASHAADALQQHFRRETVQYKEEGIILKAGDSTYNDRRKPWIKIKQDYIRGYGDTVDFVVLGCRWSKGRGRELRVGPTVNTTFYVGCITNMDQVKQHRSVRPHFEIYFTVEYGLSRQQLEDLNMDILCNGLVPFQPQMTHGLPYTFTLLRGLDPPRFLFNKPLLMELMGDRFTKAAGAPGYEVRFPRITKIWRKEERDWTEGVSLQELRQIATAALHRTPDAIARTVNIPTSPAISSDGVPTALKRLRTSEETPISVKRLRSISNLSDTPSPHETLCDPAASSAVTTPCTSKRNRAHRNSSGDDDNKENQQYRSPPQQRAPTRRLLTVSPKRSLKSTPVKPAPPVAQRTADQQTTTHPPQSPILVLQQAKTPQSLPSFPREKSSHGIPTSQDPTHTSRIGFLHMLCPGVSTHSDVCLIPSAAAPDLATDPYLATSLSDAAVWVEPPHEPIDLAAMLDSASMRPFVTLEALLVAVGWHQDRKLPISVHLRRGIIFTRHSRFTYIIDTLNGLQRTLEGRKEDVRLRILVCSVEDLESCTGTRSATLRPIWIST